LKREGLVYLVEYADGRGIDPAQILDFDRPAKGFRQALSSPLSEVWS